MDRMSELVEMVSRFECLLSRARPMKRRVATEIAIEALDLLLRGVLNPTLRDIKEELLTDETAISIREILEGNKKRFDLSSLGRELGLGLKRPTIDHIIAGHYHPLNRLKDFEVRLRETVGEDPRVAQRDRLLQWRGKLLSLESRKTIALELTSAVDRYGLQFLRDFAVQINTRDPKTGRRLAKNARTSRLIEAVTIQLWTQREHSLAQEGR